MNFSSKTDCTTNLQEARALQLAKGKGWEESGLARKREEEGRGGVALMVPRVTPVTSYGLCKMVSNVTSRQEVASSERMTT